MGLIECKYHKRAGIIFVCVHVRQDIINRKKSEQIIKIVFPDNREIESKFRYDKVLHYCFDCVNKYNFPSQNTKLADKDFNQFYDNTLFPPACCKCFTELNS